MLTLVTSNFIPRPFFYLGDKMPMASHWDFPPPKAHIRPDKQWQKNTDPDSTTYTLSMEAIYFFS